MTVSSDDGAAERLQGSVEERILPRLDDHHKTVTMSEIAKAVGVSQGAISSLLNDRDYGIRVSEKTRERVFRICRELGYIPNDLRAVVRMYPEIGDLCLLASSDIADVAADPFSSRITSAAMRIAGKTTRQLVLAPFAANADYSERSEALPNTIRNGTSSKFLCVGTPNISLFQAIIRRGFPVSCLGHEVSMPGVTSIMPAYSEASRLAIEHLFKLGHKRIAILSGPFGTTDFKIIELNQGVRIVYEQQGVPIEAQNILYGNLDFKTGVSSTEMLLSREPRPSAIFCFSDTLAAGALYAIAARGLKAPGDLSVIGCSDDAFASLLHPALSTIHLPAEEMAEAGVAEIESRIHNGDITGSKKISLPVHLVERGTCGSPGL